VKLPSVIVLLGIGGASGKNSPCIPRKSNRRATTTIRANCLFFRRKIEFETLSCLFQTRHCHLPLYETKQRARHHTAPGRPETPGFSRSSRYRRGGTEIALPPYSNLSENNVQIGVEASRAVDNKRVFVVDSDESTCAALQSMLHDETKTHELTRAEQVFTNGADRTPDLVLLGLAIVREKSTTAIGGIVARLPTLKVLPITDRAEDPLVRACLEANAHGLLAKPLSVESVRRQVDRLLSRRTSLEMCFRIAFSRQ
jgi:CheY-like chemotaxis protein